MRAPRPGSLGCARQDAAPAARAQEELRARQAALGPRDALTVQARPRRFGASNESAPPVTLRFRCARARACAASARMPGMAGLCVPAPVAGFLPAALSLRILTQGGACKRAPQHALGELAFQRAGCIQPGAATPILTLILS